MKKPLFFLAALALACVGCRTAGTFDSAKRALCAAKDGVNSAVVSATQPFGLPGTIVGGLLATAVNLACATVDVATEAAKGVTGAVIDKPLEFVGAIPVADPTASAGGSPPVPAPPHP